MDYRRDRVVIFDVHPEAMDRMYAAREAGNEEGAQQALIDFMESEHGYPSWGFGDLEGFCIW